MKRKLIALSVFTLLLFGCSSGDDASLSDYSSQDSAGTEDFRVEPEIAQEEKVIIEPGETAPDSEQLEEANRQIIYNASLDLEVKRYLDVTENIIETVTDLDGYIVSNHTRRLDEDLHEGNIQLRLPQESLDTFFNYLATHDQISINHQELVGEDVTDQYIDLETRLDSREQLEARLMTFMEEAETTEDLLNISRDLANVQYEIEQIKGQMNYIENRAELATVELYIEEQQTDFAHDQQLNVWERTKEQWLTSYNALIITGANLFVFIIGNLPIIVIILTLSGLIYWRYRKRKSKQE